MTPTIGRIVRYRLTAHDVLQIRGRRNVGQDRGNQVEEGEAVPMMIVKVHGDRPDSYVNGRLFLDGERDFWVTSVKVGEDAGTFAGPARA